MKYEVTYTLTKIIEAENAFHANDVANEQRPEGMKVLDYKILLEEECTHPRSERAYIGEGYLRCGICGEEFR